MYVDQTNMMSANQHSRALRVPQPGEIWQVSSSVQSPMQFSTEQQQQLYSEPALNFLQGGDAPRYVMIVTEAEQAEEEQWQAVSVMVFSLEIQFLSTVNILVPTTISGLEREVLAETWNVQDMLACNLSRPIGRRLSRRVYDLLLTIGDSDQELMNEQLLHDIQQLSLQMGTTSAATNSELQAFHQREESWSDVLTVPLAAYRSHLKGIQRTEQVLQAAIALEREFAVNQQRVNLSQWLQGCIEAGWQAFSVWMQETSTLAIASQFSEGLIAVRSTHSNEQSPLDSNEIAALIHQLQHETDEFRCRRLAKQLGESATSSAEAIQALIDLMRSTQDDETLWSVVESLWKLDPGNPAAGVRQVKLIDLGMQIANQSVALAVALVQKANQRVGVLLQVYPPENEPYLPANLKLVLLNERGQALREVVARQSDVYIQLKFSGASGEAFSVKIELGTASITEDFVI